MIRSPSQCPGSCRFLDVDGPPAQRPAVAQRRPFRLLAASAGFAPAVSAGQAPPPCRVIARPIDRLRADGHVSGARIGADRVRRPTRLQPLRRLRGQLNMSGELGGFGRRAREHAALWATPARYPQRPPLLANPLDRRPVPAQPLRYRPGTQPRLCHRLDHHTLAETQTLRHTQNPHRIGCRLVQPANHGRHVATTDGVRRPSSVRFVYSTDSGGLPRSTADSPRPHTTLKREEPVKPSQWFSGAYSPTVYALQIWQDDSLPCKCSPIPYRWSGEHYRRSSDSWNE